MDVSWVLDLLFPGGFILVYLDVFIYDIYIFNDIPPSSSHMRKHSFAKQVLTYYFMVFLHFPSFQVYIFKKCMSQLSKVAFFCLS